MMLMVYVLQVDVSFQTNSRHVTKLKPGHSVDVRVGADPGSLCNLLVVDKSVLLMRSGNDISPGEVNHTIWINFILRSQRIRDFF